MSLPRRVTTKLRSSLVFEVGGDVPHKALTAATDAGLAAARAAVGAEGSADAVGSLGSVRDGARTVRIELTLRVAGANAAMQAEKTFTDAFVERLASQGYEGARA